MLQIGFYFFSVFQLLFVYQLSEVEVNGQIEQVYSEMQSQAMGRSNMDNMDTMDTLPMPGSFRMRSHSYVRAIDQGCAGEEEGEGGRPLLILPSSPPRTSATTVRTIQSSTGKNRNIRKLNKTKTEVYCIALDSLGGLQRGSFIWSGARCSNYLLDSQVIPVSCHSLFGKRDGAGSFEASRYVTVHC